MRKVVITRRADDYLAALEGTAGIWGCGKSPVTALGDMISAHPEQFDVEIVDMTISPRPTPDTEHHQPNG